MRIPNLPRVQSHSFVPEGGLDLVSPVLLLKGGVAFDARNYECNIEGGVSRIGGYDRFVNGPTPAELDFRIATVTCTSGLVSTDQVLRGQTSNATMRFAAKYESDPESPGIGAGDSNIAIYVTEVSGQFVAGEVLVEQDAFIAASLVLDSVPTLLSTDSPQEVEAARVSAEAALRPYMNKPGMRLTATGSDAADTAVGPTLGVVVLDDIPYVVKRKNPAQGGTGGCVFLKPRVFADQGDTTNRDWAVAYDAEDIPAADAHFEFELSNFHDPAGSKVIYGISGTYKAFRFDGTTLTYITTGMTDDRPSHMAIHANRLFLAFKGSVQYSPLNNPTAAWSLVTGANEIAMGDDVTGLLSITGANNATALLISTKDKISILYGSSEQSFQLVPFSANTGAYPYTMQWIGQPVFQNAFGMTALSASQRFGGFNESTISGAIKPFVDARSGRARASMVCRGKNQYRLFFSDGTAIYTTFRQGRVVGSFTQKFRHKVTCAWSCMLGDGTELMLIGTEDGGLYKLDVGSSFAGLPIDHHIRFAFNHLGGPRLDKSFKRAVVELRAERYVNIQIGYDLDYGDRSRDVTLDDSVESIEGGLLWDDGNWDEGYWDGAPSTPVTLDTPGSGANISIRLRGDDNITSPFTLSAVILDYIPRRQRR